LLVKIGKAVSDFGSLELMLDEYLADIMAGTPECRGRTDVTKMNSFKKKVSLFGELICLRLGLDCGKQELDKLSQLLRRACDLRDDIVHSTYLGIAGERDKLQQRWTPGRARDKSAAGDTQLITWGTFTMTESEMEDTCA